MDLKKAEALLDKFWKGDTSTEEERWLTENAKAIRASGLKNPELKYLEYINNRQSSAELGDDFDNKILSIIEKESKPPTTFRLRSWYWQAAVIALFISLGILFKGQLFVQQKPEKVVMTDTYEDPQKAFEATKMALLLMSEKLNKGEEFTVKIQKFNELEQTIKSN